ncbi:MAG: SurA N-terminal domain-containing protein [Patescibacteria group bacterium]|nr:SurA N-terminal domain-containing protein [Patescibacteria group bacterium]MCL5431489.1 SurA N-terminal domain-containing protein [Patescibacteria group bacterium]
MPTKITRKNTRTRTPRTVKMPEPIAAMTPTRPTVDYHKVFSPRNLIILALVILLAVFAWRNKSLLVVATVNGQPVWRWELESRMLSHYGDQTLQEITNENLIKQAAAKKGVTVSSSEIDAKVADIEKSLNGQISINDALAQQGMTMTDFRNQVELQLMLEKLTADQITVTDAQVADYIASNAASLTSTDPASQAAQARQTLISQKQNAAFQSFFSQLQSQAKIVKYL